MSTFDFDKVKVVHVNVDENNKIVHHDDLNQLPQIEEKTEEKEKTNFAPPTLPIEKEKKYHWAFFLASMFTGIGLGEMFHWDAGVLFGIGGGFLFFVDPIYQKVMDKIQKW